MIPYSPHAYRSHQPTSNAKDRRLVNLLPFCVPLWLLMFSGCGNREDTDAKPVVAVKVAKVAISDVSFLVTSPATLYSRQQANIASRITAPIRELRVRKGDSVTAGQILAVLENRDIEAQHREAEAAMMDARANLEKVSSGTLPSDVARAQGQVEIAKAALNQAQKNYDRRAELFQQGAIPQRDLLLSQTELAQAKTGYDVAVKSLDLLENQSLDRDIRMAESRLAQAKAHLQWIDAELQFSELRSPFAGTITEQFMYPGDMAKPEVTLFTVMDLSVVIARAQVPEEQASEIRIGQVGRFRPVDASLQIVEGRISMVNKSVDPARRTVEVWCEIPNFSHHLRSGVFGDLVIVTGKAPNSLVVPVTAIQFKEGTRSGWVMVVDEKQAVHRREVEAGEVFEGKAQVKQGSRAMSW